MGLSGEKQLYPALLAFLRRLESFIRCDGHEVFMAHRVVQFGANIRTPHIRTPLDFLAVRRADCLVAYAWEAMESMWNLDGNCAEKANHTD